MTMAFRDLLSAEQRAKLDRMKFREVCEQQKLNSLTDAELADLLSHYLNNAFGLRRVADEYRDSPVYDSIVYYIVIPEAIRRLKGSEE